MLLNVKQIRESERITMQLEPIASIDLMERAALHFTEKLQSIYHLNDYEEIVLFCGPGNNGGDGLVIGRLLVLQNYATTVVRVNNNTVPTENNIQNQRRYEALTHTSSHAKLVDFSPSLQFSHRIIVIDAVFGIGLSKPITGYYADVIQCINELQANVVAVDVPSGLFVDRHTPLRQPCVLAQTTITFHCMKQAFVMPENEKRVGVCHIVDIGLLIPKDTKPIAKLIDANFVSPLLRLPSRFAHKGKNGTGLLIAGSAEMPGAAILSAKSAMRGGIGKLIVHVPKKLAEYIAIAIPEAVLHLDKEEDFFANIELSDLSINSIAIGPGMGQHLKSVAALKNVLNEIQSPLILDADALTILANHKTYLADLPQNSILTPHFKEFERLAGKPENDFDRWEKLKQFVLTYQVIVILKGAYSVIAFPDGNLLVNMSGNPGMATAGSGDVLTGLLLALAANGYPHQIAVILGTFMHGLAGDLALKNESYESLIASDIIANLGKAFNYIRYEK